MFGRCALLRPAGLPVFTDGHVFRFESSPYVANTTFDDFVSEAVVLNGEGQITNTNRRHLTTNHVGSSVRYRSPAHLTLKI